jgi:COMPASS component SPP1
MEVQTRLNQLLVEFQNLEKLIEKGKEQSVRERTEEDDSEEQLEMTVHCVTCGSDIHARTAVRHMERCYNKVSGAYGKWGFLRPLCSKHSVLDGTVGPFF